jgi:hypothetical protein
MFGRKRKMRAVTPPPPPDPHAPFWLKLKPRRSDRPVEIRLRKLLKLADRVFGFECLENTTERRDDAPASRRGR